LQKTADQCSGNTFIDEQVLADYDANFKVNPPLRTKKDIEVLIGALADGTIDTICSYHLPHESDAKELEFEYAAFGIASLEAAFGAARFATSGKLDTAELIKKITTNPRKVVGLPVNTIEVNQPADLTIFDMEAEWILEKQHIRSKAFNNPFIGKPLKGKPLAIINNNQIKEI
ncbi:MAG: amidohydrolase family protein, partial [Chitinophagales bacterium]